MRPADAETGGTGSPSALRVVVLTTSNPNGVSVARRLAARGIRFTVLLASPHALRHCFRRSGWRRVAELPVALARSAVRRRRTWRARRALARSGARVVTTGPTNSARMMADLTALAPDLVVLAAIGLVSDGVLALPTLGTINGHPALLPWVRGNGVVAHSLARGIAVGASVHRVDSGIDTGPILARRLLPITADCTLSALAVSAVSLADDLLADVTAKVVASGALPAGEPQSARYPLCRWMDAAPRMEIEAAVAGGLARRLFDRWAPLCQPAGDPWELPPRALAPDDSVPPPSYPGARS